MNLKSRLATATAVGLLAATATACTSSPAVSYAPAAYGVPGHCYYIDDPAEATALIAAGLCPASWTPTLMPLAWHEEYYNYYASGAYYNTYVPVRYRTVWVSQSTSFYNTNKTTILVVQKQATYKGSNGKTVTGGSVSNFAPAKAPSSAPLPAGARSSAPLPVGGARSTAPAPSAPKPLSGGGARQPSRNNSAPAKVSAR